VGAPADERVIIDRTSTRRGARLAPQPRARARIRRAEPSRCRRRRQRLTASARQGSDLGDFLREAVRRPAAPAARCAIPPRRTSSRAGRQLAPHREPPPPPPSCTDWTRLVPPPVLTGHVSSLLPYQLAPHCEASAVIFVGSDCLTISAQASPPAPPLASPPVPKPPAPRRRSRAPPPRPLPTEAPSCAPARGRPGAGSRGGAPCSRSLHHARRRPRPARPRPRPARACAVLPLPGPRPLRAPEARAPTASMATDFLMRRTGACDALS